MSIVLFPTSKTSIAPELKGGDGGVTVVVGEPEGINPCFPWF